jgi:hypothetical protein
MSDKKLEQWINIKLCVKIGKSASEMSALLTVAYGEYTMKKLSVFEWHHPSSLPHLVTCYFFLFIKIQLQRLGYDF